MKRLITFLYILLFPSIFLLAQNEKTGLFKKGKELGEKAKENVNIIGHKIN